MRRVQPDQEKVIFCINYEQFGICTLESSRWPAKAWAIAEVAEASGFLDQCCRPIGAALIGTADPAALCRRIERELGLCHPVSPAPKALPARLCRTPNPAFQSCWTGPVRPAAEPV